LYFVDLGDSFAAAYYVMFRANLSSNFAAGPAPGHSRINRSPHCQPAMHP
jgi:hypothetical protein